MKQQLDKLSKRLGVTLPIIQAPMAGVQDSRLALAVSSAGGLGSLPCGMLDGNALQNELRLIAQQAQPPINLNFFCHKVPEEQPAGTHRWHQTLQPYFDEFNVDVDTIPSGPSRRPFSHETIDILAPHKPPILSFHFGLPAPDLLARIKTWNPLILSTATTVDEALWLAANGADAIIAQGLEAGGHRGMFLSKELTTQSGTFALLPQIAQRIDLPIIAAGGIADAHGVAAALTLGAAAVQVGTAYLLSDEAKTTPIHRSTIKSARAQHTVITNLFSGGYARGIINRVIEELGPISEAAPGYPLAGAAMSAIRRQAEKQGSGDFSPLWCGQNATGCEERSAAEITRSLAAGIHTV